MFLFPRLCRCARVCECLCTCTKHIHVIREGGLKRCRVGVTGGCELLGVGSGNWIQGLWRSSHCSHLLSHLSSPKVLIFQRMSFYYRQLELPGKTQACLPACDGLNQAPVLEHLVSSQCRHFRRGQCLWW